MTDKELLLLFDSMDMQERVDQMAQINVQFYESGEFSTGPSAYFGIQPEDAQQAGTILNVIGAERTRHVQDLHMASQKHRIPLMFMADVIHGYRTVFPIPLAQGAAFDPAAVEEAAAIAAREAYASGLTVTFSPMVDLARDARWGRCLESCGEDPYLNSLLAAAQVRGFQGENAGAPGRIAACTKHFAGYGAPEGGREYAAVELSPRTLEEDHLPAYKAAVDAGSELVMCGFHTIDRIPCTGNRYLLKDVLRNRWGFRGLVISDWASIEEMIVHGYAENQREAAKKAALAGVDIDMGTGSYSNNLVALAAEDPAIAEWINAACLRILRLKNKMGLFENPYRGADPEAEKRLHLCAEHRAKARELACKSFVLLENQGDILPLRKTAKVAHIGPYVDEKAVGGGWAVFNDDNDNVTIREALAARKDITVAACCKGSFIASQCHRAIGRIAKPDIIFDFDERQAETMLKEAEETARTAETVVLYLGEHNVYSGEGGSSSQLLLPKCQLELLRRVHAVNENVVTVLFTGRPMDLRLVKELSKAILCVWYPGTESGNAVMDVLYGDADPGGRLSMSFPYTAGQEPMSYHDLRTGRPAKELPNRFSSRYLDVPIGPLYPFGYGLSYTKFRISEVELSACIMTRQTPITVSVSVKNTGHQAGTELVQLYIRDDSASVARPARQIKGFTHVHLEPGEERKVSFEICEEMLRFYDADMRFTSEPGKFTVYVGASSATENAAEFQLV